MRSPLQKHKTELLLFLTPCLILAVTLGTPLVRRAWEINTAKVVIDPNDPLNPDSGREQGWVDIKSFSGSEQPFIQLRQELTAQFKSGVSAQSLFREHLPGAIRGETEALYMLGLCAHENTVRGQGSFEESNKMVREALYLLRKAPDTPNSYEFVRMRFLLSSRTHARQTLRIGSLLLEQQPDDVDVEFRLLNARLKAAQQENEFRSVLKQAQLLQQKYPDKRDGVRSVFSYVYSVLANMGWDKTARAKEIAIYRELLTEYKQRPQTPRLKQAIENAEHLLKYAQKQHRAGRQ